MNQLERLHGLDFCRAIFMVLGVFYHVALIYNVEQDWRVGSNDTSQFFSIISLFIHDFRMEAFYVIAGFFYIYIYKKGKGSFLVGRIKRALIPLFFCGLTINYLMNIYSYNFSFDYFDVNYYLYGKWLGHLWFLGNLIIYFLLLQPFCKYISALKGTSELKLCSIFIVFAPIASILLLAVSKYTVSNEFIFIAFHSLFGYFPYFLLGCLCCTWKITFLNILNYKVFFISILIYLLIFLIAKLEIDSTLVSKVFERLSHGSLVLAMIALFYKLGTKKGSLIKEISDSSYTIYLLHQPLIVLIYAFIFLDLALNIYLEYVLLVSMVLVISYLFHRYIVRFYKVMSLLFNGVYKINRT